MQIEFIMKLNLLNNNLQQQQQHQKTRIQQN
jgi:hypothetical protein